MRDLTYGMRELQAMLAKWKMVAVPPISCSLFSPQNQYSLEPLSHFALEDQTLVLSLDWSNRNWER